MTPQDQLDRLQEAFKEWNNFPCNKSGASKQADCERIRFKNEINELLAKVSKGGN